MKLLDNDEYRILALLIVSFFVAITVCEIVEHIEAYYTFKVGAEAGMHQTNVNDIVVWTK